MLMGRYLLEELEIGLDGLDHQTFAQALRLVEQRSDSYLARAEERIGEALVCLFTGRDRTLQRLSATFRRADLVDMLLNPEENPNWANFYLGASWGVLGRLGGVFGASWGRLEACGNGPRRRIIPLGVNRGSIRGPIGALRASDD